jgi:hypothetical protein
MIFTGGTVGAGAGWASPVEARSRLRMDTVALRFMAVPGALVLRVRA